MLNELNPSAAFCLMVIAITLSLIFIIFMFLITIIKFNNRQYLQLTSVIRTVSKYNEGLFNVHLANKGSPAYMNTTDDESAIQLEQLPFTSRATDADEARVLQEREEIERLRRRSANQQ